MSNLWRPYAIDSDEEILDHRKSIASTSLKEEPRSAAPTPPPPTQPQTPAVPYGYYIPATVESMMLAYQYSHLEISPNTVAQEFNYDSNSLESNPEYVIFERDALRAMAEKNGGTLAVSNPRMRRSVRSSKEEDGGYRQQRERNNIAAKQSRDRRKLREVKLALKVSFLEKQTRKLHTMLASGKCSKCLPHDDVD